jgi:hypothetical protein
MLQVGATEEEEEEEEEKEEKLEGIQNGSGLILRCQVYAWIVRIVGSYTEILTRNLENVKHEEFTIRPRCSVCKYV